MNASKLSISLASALIIALAVFNLFFSGSEGGEPLKTAEQLAALPDDQLEGAVLTELGRDTYREGSPPEAWRRMNSCARHLWSVASISHIDPVVGLAGWLAAIQEGYTAPGPEDMRDGLAAMGLEDARRIMDQIISQRDSGDKKLLGQLHGQLNQALGAAETRKIRLAWIREHLTDLL